MADCSKFIIKGTTYNVHDAVARTSLGDLTDLNTSAKDSVVAAINEVNNKAVTVNYESASETITIH